MKLWNIKNDQYEQSVYSPRSSVWGWQNNRLCDAGHHRSIRLWHRRHAALECPDAEYLQPAPGHLLAGAGPACTRQNIIRRLPRRPQGIRITMEKECA